MRVLNYAISPLPSVSAGDRGGAGGEGGRRQSSRSKTLVNALMSEPRETSALHCSAGTTGAQQLNHPLLRKMKQTNKKTDTGPIKGKNKYETKLKKKFDQINAQCMCVCVCVFV